MNQRKTKTKVRELKKKKRRDTENNTRDIWGDFKTCNKCVIVLPREKKRKRE